MKQDDLGKALRELPRTEPSIGFRRRVLNRVEERRVRRAAWRPAYLAAALALVMAIPIGVLVRDIRAERRSRQRVETLRQEYRSLEQELLELQRMAVRSRPLVGVEGPGEYDYVIDLRNLYAEPERVSSDLARPASFRSSP